MQSVKKQLSNETKKHGLGGAPANYMYQRRRRSDHQK